MRTEEWREDAECLRGVTKRKGGHDPDFFPETDGETPGLKGQMRAKAKAICGRCLVVDECLNDALRMEGDADANHRYGVRGAMDPGQRATESRRRKNESR